MAAAKRILAAALLVLTAAACAGPATRSSEDFGQTAVTAPPTPSGASGASSGAQLAMGLTRASVPVGFRAVPEAIDIVRPSGLAIDPAGGVVVIEAGNQLRRLGAGGGRDLITQGPAGANWTGVAAGGGAFFVTAAGDGGSGGRLLRVELDGRTAVLLQDLPQVGLSAPAVGADGMVYLATATVSDAGVVADNAPGRGANPALRDIPCQNVQLQGRNFTEGRSQTGAFVPFGSPTQAGQVVEGQLPCSGAVLRTTENGGAAQLVAWGFHRPHGLAFTPEGRLYLLDDSFRGDGVRAEPQGGNLIYAVAAGLWYGWPDVHGSRPAAPPLLAAQPNPPPRPLAELAPDLTATALDATQADLFGGSVQAYLAVAVPNYGFRILRCDLRTGRLVDFAEFPEATSPVALRFSPTGDALYVLEQGGTLWRIEREVPVG